MVHDDILAFFFWEVLLGLLGAHGIQLRYMGWAEDGAGRDGSGSHVIVWIILCLRTLGTANEQVFV